jgi:hypothetical protein
MFVQTIQSIMWVQTRVPKVLKFLALALAHSVENLEVAIGKIDLPPDALEALKTVADQQSRDAVAAKTQMEEKK